MAGSGSPVRPASVKSQSTGSLFRRRCFTARPQASNRSSMPAPNIPCRRPCGHSLAHCKRRRACRPQSGSDHVSRRFQNPSRRRRRRSSCRRANRLRGKPRAGSRTEISGTARRSPADQNFISSAPCNPIRQMPRSGSPTASRRSTVRNSPTRSPMPCKPPANHQPC